MESINNIYMNIKIIAAIVLFILLASFAILVMRGSRSHTLLQSKQIALKESNPTESTNQKDPGNKSANKKKYVSDTKGSQSVINDPELLSKVPGEYIDNLSKTNFSVSPLTIPKLNADGVRDLLELFKQNRDKKTPLRFHAAVALSWIAGEEVVSEFINVLKEMYNLNSTDRDEVNYYCSLISCMGLLARNNQSAMDYLMKVTEVKPISAWELRSFREVCCALVCTEKPEAERRLMELADRVVAENEDPGALVDQIFYKTLIKENGITNIFGQLDGERMMAYFHLWTKTDEGIKWCKWAKSIEAIQQSKVQKK